MNAPLLPAVDLRSNIETVYHQAGTNACTAHAVINCLDAAYDHAGQSKRFSRAWVWWWSRVNSGRAGQDVGANFGDLKFALEQKGVLLESQHPWTGSAANFPPKDAIPATGPITFVRASTNVDDIKRRLCLGMPTVLGITLRTSWYDLAGQRNWRTSSHSMTAPFTNTQHAICVVGYDDAAGRFLVENSSGPGFADGGFFGLPYEHLPLLFAECWAIGRIEGFQPKPVEGFVSIPYLLDARDSSEFLINNKQKLRDMAQSALQTNGIPGVLDFCREWYVTDKLLENLFLWDRGTINQFQRDNPSLNWTNFPWAPL